MSVHSLKKTCYSQYIVQIVQVLFFFFFFFIFTYDINIYTWTYACDTRNLSLCCQPNFGWEYFIWEGLYLILVCSWNLNFIVCITCTDEIYNFISQTSIRYNHVCSKLGQNRMLEVGMGWVPCDSSKIVPFEGGSLRPSCYFHDLLAWQTLCLCLRGCRAPNWVGLKLLCVYASTFHYFDQPARDGARNHWLMRLHITE